MSTQTTPAAGTDEPVSTAAPRGPVTSASYSLTVRLTSHGDPASIGRIGTAVGPPSGGAPPSIGRFAPAVGTAGGPLSAFVDGYSRSDGLPVDVTRPAAD